MDFENVGVGFILVKTRRISHLERHGYRLVHKDSQYSSDFTRHPENQVCEPSSLIIMLCRSLTIYLLILYVVQGEFYTGVLNSFSSVTCCDRQ